MIHTARQNQSGYLGYIREFEATDKAALPTFEFENMLTVFAYMDRLVIVGVTRLLRAWDQETSLAFLDPMAMMARAHRSFAPYGPEVLRNYAKGGMRRLPVAEIMVSSITGHSLQPVPRRPLERHPRLGLKIFTSTGRVITLVSRAEYVYALRDWLTQTRQQ